jgi:hypothetical protein
MTSSIIEDDDLVFNKIDGKIQSAGFSVNSILMQKGEPVVFTRNSGLQTGGGNVSDLFKDLAVPAGLAYFTRKQYGGEEINNNRIINNADETVSNDLHDKLLNMVEFNDKNKFKRTRRVKHSKTGGKTKKMRNVLIEQVK